MKYLSEYMENGQTELFNKTGAFFAFGKKQFDEQKVEGVKYASCGMGLICPTDQVDVVRQGLKQIADDAIAEDIKDNGVSGIIEREYFNHECQISCSTEDVENALKGYQVRYPKSFTDERMQKVFAKCYKKAIRNDWF